MNWKTTQHIFLDGDGVLYHGSQAVPGLNDFFDMLAAEGIGWALITNNAGKTRQQYIEKLSYLGIAAEPGQIFSSALVTAQYAAETYGTDSAFYVVAPHGVKAHMRELGITVYEGNDRPPGPVDGVVVGLDRDVTYEKITIATVLIRAGAPFIGTNPDLTYPAPGGELHPGAGTIVTTVQASSGQVPTVIGKPQPTIFEIAMNSLNAKPETSVMVGDRLDTDILGGQRAGMGTALVMTGVTNQADLNESEIQPDVVYPALADLTKQIREVRRDA